MKPFLTVILLFFACLLVNFEILAAAGKRKQRGRHHRGQRGSLAKSIPVNNGRAGRDVSVSDGKVDESASEDSSSSSSGIDETVAGRKRKHSDDGSVDDEESSASDTDVRPLVRTDAGFFVASADFDAVYRSLLSRPPSSSCSEPPSEPEDRRVRKDRLRIASFNAEWLFLFGGSGTVQCPGKGCPWQNLKGARKHFFRVLRLINKLDADIVHLNEVEDCRVLEALLRLLPPGHGYAAYMIPGTDTTTGQQVALLTRIDPVIGLSRSSSRAAYPIVGSTCGIGRSFSKGQLRSGHAGLSKHYLAQFEISLTLQEKRHGGGGSKLRKIAAAKEGSKSVFYQAKSRLKSSILSSTPTPSMPQDSFSFTLLLAGAHFLAQSDNADRCLRREAQATVLTRLLQGAIDRLTARRGRHRPIEIIVTGDFNDHDSEAVGADGEQPLSSTLQVLKRVAGYRLRTAASWIRDQADRYSSWHDRNRNCLDDGKPEHSLIDHVLLSEGLHGRLRSVWMDHNATVSCRDRVSDHFPIILDIA